MRVRWLGWAGLEIEADGASLVVDALRDPGAVFAALEGAEQRADLPEIVAPETDSAVAGLVTHLHRDHADAGALSDALAAGAPVLEPPAGGGEGLANLGIAQAEHELAAAGLERRRLSAWESAQVGPFTVTALPAVDGTGDPQVSWLVEADGLRVLHCGDTLFHGYWWRMALRHGPFDIAFLPVNGAVLEFPHRKPASPLPAAMTPDQAAVAGAALGSRVNVPMHYDGFAIEPFYRPLDHAAERFREAALARGCEPRLFEPGESLELDAVTA